MLFYFSATGSCLHVARNLDDNPLSIAQELKKDERVYQDETMGMVSPIYGGELPTIVRDFIATATFQTDYFYVVLTYGNLDTAAAEWTYYFAKSHRVNIYYIGTIKMVDNYLSAFDMNKKMAMDKHKDDQILQVKVKIAARVALILHPDEKARHMSRLKENFESTKIQLSEAEVQTINDTLDQMTLGPVFLGSQNQR